MPAPKHPRTRVCQMQFMHLLDHLWPQAHTYHLLPAFVFLLELQMCGYLQGTRDTVWSQNRWPLAGQTSQATSWAKSPTGCRKTLREGCGFPSPLAQQRWGLGQPCISGCFPFSAEFAAVSVRELDVGNCEIRNLRFQGLED